MAPHGQRPPDRDPQDKIPLDRDTPWMETSPRQRSPWTETPSKKDHRTRDRDPSIRNMGRVGGMYPTGMISCLHIVLKSSVSLKSQFC